MNVCELYVRKVCDLFAEERQPIPFRILGKYGRTFRHEFKTGTGVAEKQQCYRNSTMLMLEGRGDYCEGYAAPQNIGIPIAHAWLTKGDDAFDPTWDSGGCYFGVRFKSSFVLRMAQHTGHWGVFENLHGLKMPSNEVFDMLVEGIEK